MAVKTYKTEGCVGWGAALAIHTKVLLKEPLSADDEIIQQHYE